MQDNMFAQLDFGAFQEYIDNDDITDISYTNNGQIWVRSLEKGSLRVENPNINNAVVEKLAFQCSNVMGTTFNNASPFLDAESPELRMNFVHESIATNGIALVIRKTPAKIRLKEDTLLKSDYITKDVHDFLMKCVQGHCNIMVCGETGSGKTEFVKYLASHTKEEEKLITIEDTLELHLDRIYPTRDIVAMKTNNIASYSDVLVTCMRQNPKWILLSEVRSAEAVTAVRNSISSGHNILSTIHSDKASAIPHRLYSLMETDLDLEQFLGTIYRYIQLGVHIKAYYSQKLGKFHREIDEITEFYMDEETNKPVYNTIYQKNMAGQVKKKQPSEHLMNYLLGQNIIIGEDIFNSEDSKTEVQLDLDKMVEKPEEEIKVEERSLVYEKPVDKNKEDPSVEKMNNLLNPSFQKVEEENSGGDNNEVNNENNGNESIQTEEPTEVQDEGPSINPGVDPSELQPVMMNTPVNNEVAVEEKIDTEPVVSPGVDPSELQPMVNNQSQTPVQEQQVVVDPIIPQQVVGMEQPVQSVQPMQPIQQAQPVQTPNVINNNPVNAGMMVQQPLVEPIVGQQQ